MGSPVTLDFSRAQRLDSAPVTLDFSKAQRLDGQANQAELRAPETGVRPWLRSLEGDLRYGGQQTLPGRLLHKMGYQAPEPLGGEGGTAGSMIVSPLTGPVFAAHGVAEAASGHPLRGAGEFLSGVGEAAQIPMAFGAPETAEAATTSRAAQATGAAARAVLPSVIRRIPYVGHVAGDVYDAGRNAWQASGPVRNRTISSGEMADYMGGATPRDVQVQPQRLSDQIKSGTDVTPQLKQAPATESGYYATDQKAWQRYPQTGSAQDMEETKSLQEQIRDQAAREQYGRIARGNEEGFARNTRPRTSKGQLSQQFQSGKSGARLADKIRQAPGSSSGEDLTDILQKSVNQVKAKKAGGSNPPTASSQ